MNQRSKKLTWTFVTLLVMFFLFWGAKTYSENYRVKAEKELDHVHGELQVVVDVMNQPYLFHSIIVLYCRTMRLLIPPLDFQTSIMQQ